MKANDACYNDNGVKASTPGERIKSFPMLDSHENRISYLEAYIDECEIVFKDFEIRIKKIEDEMKKTAVKIYD